MAAFNYSRPKATADRMLARYGQAATLVRPTATGPAYNPTPGAPGSLPVRIVVTNYSNREVDGTRVLASDKKVLMAKGALAIEPALSDKLLIGGVAHSIVRIDPLAPGGLVVMWTIQCRR